MSTLYCCAGINYELHLGHFFPFKWCMESSFCVCLIYWSTLNPVLYKYWSDPSSAPTMQLNICKAVSRQALLSINAPLLLQRFISIWAITGDKVAAQPTARSLCDCDVLKEAVYSSCWAENLSCLFLQQKNWVLSRLRISSWTAVGPRRWHNAKL